MTWRTPVLQSRVLSLRDGTWLPYHAGSQDQNSGIWLSAQLHLVRVGEKESPHCTWGNDGQSPLPQRLSPSPQPCRGSVTFSLQCTVRACRMPGTATDSEKAAVQKQTQTSSPPGALSHTCSSGRSTHPPLFLCGHLRLLEAHRGPGSSGPVGLGLLFV